jgi:exopolysaccharide biosynthesis polyprenyl glycosylphosphotransferase
MTAAERIHQPAVLETGQDRVASVRGLGVDGRGPMPAARVLVILDVAALMLAWLGTFLLVSADAEVGIVTTVVLASGLAASTAVLLVAMGVHARWRADGRIRELFQISRAVAAPVVLVLAAFHLRELPIGSEPLLVGLPVALGGLLIVRTVRAALLSRRGQLLEPAAVVGTDAEARELCELISDHPEWGLRLAGVVGDRTRHQGSGLACPWLGDFTDAVEALTARGVTVACVPASACGSDGLTRVVRRLAGAGIRVLVTSGLRGFGPHRVQGAVLGGQRPTQASAVPAIEIAGRPGLARRMAKRAIDLLLASLALLLLAPVFAVIAVAIKLSDPGPVLYRHRRLARDGRPVDVLKFRTLRKDCCTGARYGGKTDAEVLEQDLGRPDLASEFAAEQKLKVDPRASRIGRFLRATSLDELPQLLNVLRGTLSLVGPRPIVWEELARYGGDHEDLLRQKPGVTGLWQVSGRSDVSYDERRRLDMYYIENQTVALDVAILCRTVSVVLQRRGAC